MDVLQGQQSLIVVHFGYKDSRTAEHVESAGFYPNCTYSEML